jgi:hypothetical protein
VFVSGMAAFGKEQACAMLVNPHWRVVLSEPTLALWPSEYFEPLRDIIIGEYNDDVVGANSRTIQRGSFRFSIHFIAQSAQREILSGVFKRSGYSARRAAIGSIDIARRAGIRTATTATSIKTAATPKKLSGSVGVTS